MIPDKKFIEQLRHQLANNETDAVLTQLQQWLQNNRAVDEVVMQSARHREILHQIRLGVVEADKADVTRNKIHWALLEFLRDLELRNGEVSEYDLFNQDIERYKFNQISSTSQPLIGKTVDFLNKSALKKLFAQNRVKRHFSIHQVKNSVAAEAKLKSLQLMANGYVLKGTFLCLADTEQIRSVSHNAYLSKFFVFEDLKGMRTAVAEFVTGNLIGQFEAMLGHLKRHLYLHRNIDTRTEDFEIPETVFTELLANAFIHRTYESDVLTDIKVEIYPDRIEISNPGQFPESIDLKHTEDNNKSFVVNPEIVQTFFLHNFVETAAKGIARSQHTLASQRMEPAVFEQKKGYVNVIIYRKNFSANQPPNGPDERQKRLLELKDAAAWQAAGELNTLAAYETYLDSFPEGSNAEAALLKIASLQAAEIKRRAHDREKNGK